MTLADLAPPILYTVFAWWFSTGAILWLVRLPRSTVKTSMIAMTVVLAVALVIIIVTAADVSASGAYLAFTAALVVWGWHEASFLLGVVTGPRPAACPEGATGWRRFKYATLSVLHHEVALVLTAAALVGLTWGQTNQVAAWTFLILLAMRLSAKFNIFLGVPNLTDEFVPDHLEHLKSYLPKRAMNALFPVSVAGSLVLAAWLMQKAQSASIGGGEYIGFVVLFALTALALIEHAFMILPLPDAALWRWAAPERSAAPAVEPALLATTTLREAIATNGKENGVDSAIQTTITGIERQPAGAAHIRPATAGARD